MGRDPALTVPPLVAAAEVRLAWSAKGGSSGKPIEGRGVERGTMGRTGTPARSPGRSEEATRRRIAVGIFLVATFGMVAVLSLPVSRLTNLPHRLPRPLQRALEPFLPPFARGNPQRPATGSLPSHLPPATLGTGGRFAQQGGVGPPPRPRPTPPSPPELIERPGPLPVNVSLTSAGKGRSVAGCHARVERVRRHCRHRKGHRHGPHRRNPRPRQEASHSLAPRQDRFPGRHWHGRSPSRRCG